MLGAPTQSWTPLRNIGQWVIGAALGLYFTPQVTALVGRLWWAIALGIALGPAAGLGCSAAGCTTWSQGSLPGTASEQRATSYFAGAIGGASEMTLLAERAGARTDLVAAAHSLRLLIVTLTVPCRDDLDRAARHRSHAARHARGACGRAAAAGRAHRRRAPG